MLDLNEKSTQPPDVDIDGQGPSTQPVVRGAGSKPMNVGGANVPKGGDPSKPMNAGGAMAPKGGNAAVEQSGLTAQYTPTRLPVPGAAPAASGQPREYLPPPELASGQLPTDSLVDSVDTRLLYQALQDSTPFKVPSEAGVYDALFSRMSAMDFVSNNLRNMANGGGVIEDLPPFETAVSLFNGTCRI